LAIARNYLTFLDHVYQFYAALCVAGRVEGFEAEHWPDDPFGSSEIVLDEIVQIFDLADLIHWTLILIYISSIYQLVPAGACCLCERISPTAA